MPRRRRQKLEIWIGVLTIVSVILLFWGYFWLTGQPLGERGYTAYTVLSNAGGLERGDVILLSGVEVGVVRSVELVSANRVVVRLWIRRGIELPSDSRALLESAGLFGDRTIALQPGTAETLLSAGDTLGTGIVAGLTDLAGELGEHAEAVLIKIERLLADTTVEHAQGTLASLRTTVSSLERLLRDNSDDIGALARSLRRSAENLERVVGEADVDRAIADLEVTAATLTETAESLRGSAESLASVVEKIDRGDGTIGRLVNDPSLYEELRAAARSVNSLTQDIQQNPGRYLKLAIF